MPYAFRIDGRDTAGEARHIARREMAGLLGHLDAGADPEQLHEARKRIKKLRALLRLVRPHFAGFAAENAVLRELGRSLSGLRDADAVAGAIARLGAAAEGGTAAALACLARHAPPSGAEPQVDFAALRATLREARERAQDWRITGQGFAVLEPGLRLGWKLARHGAAFARRHRTPAALHEWRKRVKDHGYHARLLAPVWPEMMAPHAGALALLGELLGDRHDLELVKAALAGSPLAEEPRARIAACIAAQAERLEDQAFALGARVLVDRPKVLARRWRRWWTIAEAGDRILFKRLA